MPGVRLAVPIGMTACLTDRSCTDRLLGPGRMGLADVLFVGWRVHQFENSGREGGAFH